MQETDIHGDIQTISEKEFLSDASTIAVWRNAQDVPEAIMRDMTSKKYDYYTPLLMGKKWLFELLNRHQPRTGCLLLQGGDLFLRQYKRLTSYGLCLGLEVNGRVVLVGRGLWGTNISEDKNCRFARNTYPSYPQAFAEAYLNRFDGLDLPPEVNLSVGHYSLPVGRNAMMPETYLGDRKGFKKTICHISMKNFLIMRQKKNLAHVLILDVF